MLLMNVTVSVRVNGDRYSSLSCWRLCSGFDRAAGIHECQLLVIVKDIVSKHFSHFSSLLLKVEKGSWNWSRSQVILPSFRL